jgi:hypothetical protein
VTAEEEGIALGWGGEPVPLHSYVSFYYSDDETMRRSLAFLRVGLDEAGTFNIVLAARDRHQGLIDEATAAHGGIDHLVAAGKLAVVPEVPTVEQIAETEDTTSLQELATAVGTHMQSALDAGFVRIRALGFMDWSQPGWPDLEALKRCEAQIRQVAAFFPVVVVCAYRMLQLPGQLVLESALGNEPVVVVHDPVGLT